MKRLAYVVLVVLAFGCENASPLNSQPTGSNAEMPTTSSMTSSGSPAAGPVDIDSKDILGRAEVSPSVDVKHVLVGWKELAPAYRGHMDPRAAKRTQAEAAARALEIAEKMRAHPDQLDEIVMTESEDPGSKQGQSYTVDDSSQFVPEFKKLAVRLKPGEVGIVKTMFGYHVMSRVTPDPLVSADILARSAETGPVWVQHVLVSWKDAPAVREGHMEPDAARDARTKADADKIATEVLAKARANEDFTALMKQYSEDPGSKDDGMPYRVTEKAQLVPAFKALGLRLKMGEVGMVKTDFGWHIMKRVPQPPPDALESKDILERKDVAPKVKVKHILLGYDKAHVNDPRGAKRTYAELAPIVKDTLAKLQKGDKIEPLMAELSEDPRSAKDGKPRDVTPDSPGLPDAYKDLATRLKVGETGVVKTEVGFFILQRIE